MAMRILWVTMLVAAITSAGFMQAPTASKANAPSDLGSLVAIEREFARTAAAKGMRTAFLAFIADDCVLFRPDPINGKTWWSGQPDNPGLLSWEPIYADVAQSGDLGYTTGPFEFRPGGAADKPASQGYYMSIWRRQADGSWKFVIDQGTPTPAHKDWPAAVSFSGNRRQDAVWDQNSNVETQAREELLDMEHSFTRASADNTLQAFVNHAAENVRFMRSGNFPQVGRAAMQKALAAAPCILHSTPLFAAAARSGDLGYAYGTYECRPARQSGQTADPEKGIYVRIWKRPAKGEWRIVLDLLSPYRQPA